MSPISAIETLTKRTYLAASGETVNFTTVNDIQVSLTGADQGGSIRVNLGSLTLLETFVRPGAETLVFFQRGKIVTDIIVDHVEGS
jgi:hypothetical protein